MKCDTPNMDDPNYRNDLLFLAALYKTDTLAQLKKRVADTQRKRSALA